MLKPEHNPSRGRGGGPEVPPLAEELVTNDSCWEREVRFFFFQEYIPCQIDHSLEDGLIPKSTWAAHLELGGLHKQRGHEVQVEWLGCGRGVEGDELVDGMCLWEYGQNTFDEIFNEILWKHRLMYTILLYQLPCKHSWDHWTHLWKFTYLPLNYFVMSTLFLALASSCMPALGLEIAHLVKCSTLRTWARYPYPSRNCRDACSHL